MKTRKTRKTKRSRTARRRISHRLGHWVGLFFLEGLAVGVILYLIATRVDTQPTPPGATSELVRHPTRNHPPTLAIDPQWQRAP